MEGIGHHLPEDGFYGYVKKSREANASRVNFDCCAFSTAAVILRERSEPKDLRMDFTYALSMVRRSFDFADAPLRMTTFLIYSPLSCLFSR